MRLLVPLLFAIAPIAPLAAAELHIDLEIPQLNVAEYHRPYVAVWIARPDHGVAANLGVWYDLKLAHREGEKWLKDLRQWWRRSGRSLEFPVDGVSAATRPPGRHTLHFTAADAPLAGLPAGDYQLVIEAVREVGGRELLSLPFAWPPAVADTAAATGSSELGRVQLRLTPPSP